MMLTDPRSVVSRSVRPSLVFKAPVRTAETCCEPGSAGGAGSLASAAKLSPASSPAEKRKVKTWKSATPRAMEKSLRWKCVFIVKRNFLPSKRLLYFPRTNLPQRGGAAQPHVTAGVAALQLLQGANHMFHGRILFRTHRAHGRR